MHYHEKGPPSFAHLFAFKLEPVADTGFINEKAGFLRGRLRVFCATVPCRCEDTESLPYTQAPRLSSKAGYV